MTPGNAAQHDVSVWGENPALEPELRRLVAKGVSAASIARTLRNGVTRNAVVGKCKRLGLQLAGSSAVLGKRRMTKAQTAEALERERHCQPPSPPRRFTWERLDVS